MTAPDYLERLHVSLFMSDLAILRRAYPPGKVAEAIRDIIHAHCEENHVRLTLLAAQREPTNRG